MRVRPLNTPLILLVGLDAAGHDRIARFVESAGLEVLSVNSGAESERHLAGGIRPVGVVIDLDCQDPDLDRLARQVMGGRYGWRAPIILIGTAARLVEAPEQRSGDAILEKPVDGPTMIGLLARIAARDGHARIYPTIPAKFRADLETKDDGLIDALIKAGEVMEEQLFNLSLINRISLVAQTTSEIPEVAGRVLDLAAQVTRATSCALLVWDGARSLVLLSRGSAPGYEAAVHDLWEATGARVTPFRAVTPHRIAFIVKRGEVLLGMLAADLPLPLDADPHQKKVFELFARELGPLLERGLALARLRESYESRLEFVRFLSHDLRNPLTGVLSTLRFIAASAGQIPPETLRSLAEAGVRSGSQLDKMLSDLLEFHGGEAGGFEVKLDRTALAAVVQEGIDPFRSAAEAKGIEIEMASFDRAPAVIADRRLLLRVIENLLANAVKFSRTGPVRVRWVNSPERVTITVTDSAPPIPTEAMDSLFAPFYRVPGTAREVPGTGLGLAFSERALTEMGGRIWVENRSAGNRFSISLPRWKGRARHGDAPVTGKGPSCASEVGGSASSS